MFPKKENSSGGPVDERALPGRQSGLRLLDALLEHGENALLGLDLKPTR